MAQENGPSEQQIVAQDCEHPPEKANRIEQALRDAGLEKLLREIKISPSVGLSDFMECLSNEDLEKIPNLKSHCKNVPFQTIS